MTLLDIFTIAFASGLTSFVITMITLGKTKENQEFITDTQKRSTESFKRYVANSEQQISDLVHKIETLKKHIDRIDRESMQHKLDNIALQDKYLALYNEFESFLMKFRDERKSVEEKANETNKVS